MKKSTRKTPVNALSKEKWIKEFSKRLCYRMEYLGITQTELAKMINVDQSNVSMWMRGLSGCNSYHAVKIAKALSMDLDDLIGF